MGKAASRKEKTGFRKKTIRKPKFIYEFLKCGAVCLVIALGISWFMLNKKLDSINDDYEENFTEMRRKVELQISELVHYEENDPRYAICMNELEKDMYTLAAFGGPGGRAEVWIKGEKVFETPRGYVAWIAVNENGRDANGRINPNYTEYYFLEDESYLSQVLADYEPTSPSTYPHDAFASYFRKDDDITVYTYSIDRVLINRATHRFIPEFITVYASGKSGSGEIWTANAVPVVPEGYERIPSSSMSGGQMQGFIPREGTAHELKHSREWRHVEDEMNDENAEPYCMFWYSDYSDYTLTEVMPYETAVFLVGALVIGILAGLLPASVFYHRKKTVWEIYDYRKKTTEAMAHDLKTPLATISAYAESIEEASPEQKDLYAGKIRENVSEMNRMVENILYFSKSETIGRSVSKTEVDAGEIVRETVAKLGGLFEKNQIRTDVVTEGKCVLTTDEKMLRQAIDNLVSNCAKYAQKDTVVKILVSEEKISFRNQTTEKIEDAEALKKPFVKGDGARGENGTGLGLSIADNNLLILGYPLALSFQDGWFEAQVLFPKT